MSTWTPPEFTSPPIVETIFGVQFSPVNGFTSGHFGWFWREYLGNDWPRSADAPYLIDQFEKFGEGLVWTQPASSPVMAFPAPFVRLQISNAADDRVIQLQNTRFLYNWRKQRDPYPPYAKRLAEFRDLYEKFKSFIGARELGELKPNQWEVSYINHIPKGMLWQTPTDWPRLLPGLLKPVSSSAQFEGVGDWHLEIPPQKGRLHISLQNVRVGSVAGPEVLNLVFTTRGPVRESEPADLEAGLNIGHESIVRSFAEMTSPDAQKAWGRK